MQHSLLDNVVTLTKRTVYKSRWREAVYNLYMYKNMYSQVSFPRMQLPINWIRQACLILSLTSGLSQSLEVGSFYGSVV